MKVMVAIDVSERAALALGRYLGQPSHASRDTVAWWATSLLKDRLRAIANPSTANDDVSIARTPLVPRYSSGRPRSRE